MPETKGLVATWNKYLPTSITALAFLSLIALYFLRGIFFGKDANTSVRPPPVYGPWYLPRFIRGCMAMIRLGADEDTFLRTVRQQYGPVVYLPWPLCQIFVLDGEIIQSVYSSPTTTLTFAPYRMFAQTYAFGTPEKITKSGVLERRVHPIHGKGLANVRLEPLLQRFIQVVEAKVSELGEKVEAAGGTLEIGLVKWIIDTMFEAGASALFGEEFRARAVEKKLQSPFNSFDASFPLLSSGMIPPFLFPYLPPTVKGIKSRDIMIQALTEWVEDGMPGLEEGIITDLAEIGFSEGFSTTEIGSLMVGALWALQANAPHAAASLFLYILQSPVLQAIREEIDLQFTDSASSAPTLSLKTLASMPLAASCIQETIRLNTSSFSIRRVEKSFVLPTSTSEKSATDQGFLIPTGSGIICATRTAHLSDEIWGEDPSVWDGERFMDRDGEDKEAKNKKTKGMRAFGGGISICEGRHLATAELKILLALTLSAFDMRPLYATFTDGQTRLPPASHTQVNIQGLDGRGIFPARLSQRPGMGAFQFGGADVVVEVKKRA